MRLYNACNSKTAKVPTQMIKLQKSIYSPYQCLCKSNNNNTQ